MLLSDQSLTWGRLLADASRRVPETEARRILERASGYDGAEVMLVLHRPPTARALAQFDRMVDRRAAGEPLQYVVGSWGFRSLDLYLDRRVLIPRPETEVVVEVALAEARRFDGAVHIADLGTGSGAIALAVAAELVPARVWATDASAAALEVARANLAGLGRPATRVRLCEGEWYQALPDELRGTLHVVVSNPPYVAESEELPAEVVDWEPRSALVAGATGLEAIEAVIGDAPAWLARPGSLVVEIAPHQAAAATDVALRAGFVEVDVRPDLAGRDRVLVARQG